MGYCQLLSDYSHWLTPEFMSRNVLVALGTWSRVIRHGKQGRGGHKAWANASVSLRVCKINQVLWWNGQYRQCNSAESDFTP